MSIFTVNRVYSISLSLFSVAKSALKEVQAMIVQGFIELNELNCETSNKLASFKSNSSPDQQVYYEKCQTSHAISNTILQNS